MIVDRNIGSRIKDRVRIRTFEIALLLLLLCEFGGFSKFGLAAEFRQLEGNVPAEQDRLDVKRLVAMVTANFDEGTRLGAAIVIGYDESGVYLLTANHLVRRRDISGSQITATVQLNFLEMTPVGVSVTPFVSEERDMAILKAELSPQDMMRIREYRMDVLVPGARTSLKEDDPIYMLGQPQGRRWRMNGTPERLKVWSGPTYEFESALLDVGHSGGALLNGEFQILGMVRSQSAPYGFALPISNDVGFSIPGFSTEFKPQVSGIREFFRYWKLPFRLTYARPQVLLGEAYICVRGEFEVTSWCVGRMPWQPDVPPVDGPFARVRSTIRLFDQVRLRFISGSSSHICGVTIESDTLCMGQNGSGQIGAPSGPRIYTVPIAVQASPNFKSIFSASAYSCGLTLQGLVYCWGDNQYGQLGDGTKVASHIPIRVAGTSRFISLSVGEKHACAINTGKQLYCWGQSDLIGTKFAVAEFTDSTLPMPLNLVRPPFRTVQKADEPPSAPEFDLVEAVSVGDGYTCALDRRAQLYCWGINTAGRLGTGDTSNSAVPALIANGMRFKEIQAGPGNHTCGISMTNKVYCWGDNSFGQIGIGSRDSVGIPTEVKSDRNFNYLWIGPVATCAGAEVGGIFCWGKIPLDPLGSPPRFVPTPMRLSTFR